MIVYSYKSEGDSNSHNKNQNIERDSFWISKEILTVSEEIVDICYNINDKSISNPKVILLEPRKKNILQEF